MLMSKNVNNDVSKYSPIQVPSLQNSSDVSPHYTTVIVLHNGKSSPSRLVFLRKVSLGWLFPLFFNIFDKT